MTPVLPVSLSPHASNLLIIWFQSNVYGPRSRKGHRCTKYGFAISLIREFNGGVFQKCAERLHATASSRSEQRCASSSVVMPQTLSLVGLLSSPDSRPWHGRYVWYLVWQLLLCRSRWHHHRLRLSLSPRLQCMTRNSTLSNLPRLRIPGTSWWT